MQETLKRLYQDEGCSRQELSEQLGCTFEQVTYLLKKFGVRKNQRHSYLNRGRKRCPSCMEEKDLSEFYKRKDSSPGSWCKQCMNNQAVVRQRKHKKIAVQYKGGSCLACGFSRYAGALDFHHLDPKRKDTGIAKLARSPLTDKVRQELDKCVLLCANCHRMVHGNVIIINDQGVVLTTPWSEASGS